MELKIQDVPHAELNSLEEDQKLKIVYLTAGAAGMYCGSCLHDNALAKALIRQGHDAMLIPTYTPVLTDEQSVSSDRLFYGGLNVYLQQASPLFRWLPNWADQFLSSPKLVGWIASRAMGTSPENLGALTVSMLRGNDGRQKKEVRRLCKWLKTQTPDVAVFSNLLIAGCIGELKKSVGCAVVVILQGDDIFYESLSEPHKSQALVQLRKLAEQVDLFVVHSRDYGLRMQKMLGYSDAQWSINPLSIDTSDFVGLDVLFRETSGPPTIGYLARLAPEKGLHLLVDAFIELHKTWPQETQLAIAGWLGPQHVPYWQEQREKLAEAGLQDHVQYHGSVDRAGKLKFLESLNILCVPTMYLEPKGLFVLEGLAAGVPYLQPAHGAFPEMHQRVGGGHLFEPEATGELARRLHELLQDVPALRELGLQGRQSVLELAATDHEAKRFAELLLKAIGGGSKNATFLKSAAV